MAKRTQDEERRIELLRTEKWANLAIAIGYDPLDVEGQGRDILKRMVARGVTASVKAPEKTDAAD